MNDLHFGAMIARVSVAALSLTVLASCASGDDRGASARSAVPNVSDAAATAVAEPRRPIYFDYVAQSGDTIERVASAGTIRANNAGLGTPVSAGAILRVPSTDGLLYQVKAGETLADIAARFSTSEMSIRGFLGNGIGLQDARHSPPARSSSFRSQCERAGAKAVVSGFGP